MHADIDTICAGLLHDTLEDTEITKQAIAEDFNKEVANLVDGVTKISKLNFSTKNDQNMANTRKIITGLTTDARIIIIKQVCGGCRAAAKAYTGDFMGSDLSCWR